MTTATVFNVQRFSLHDGPGIRTTVFLKGCPLRCVWCHNPESLDPRPEPSFKTDRCLDCDLCGAACPQDIARPLSASESNDPGATCIRCGSCAEACPAGAREWLGNTRTPDELLAEILDDRPYYASSGGGVTFSGGEPLREANLTFLREILQSCRRLGVHSAIDTCGHVPTGTLVDMAKLTDLFLFDLKHMDTEHHQRATGVGNELILTNLRAVVEAGHRVWIRVPIVPGWTDNAANLEAIADFAGGLPRPVPVYLLPYHRMARDKYTRLGRTDVELNTPDRNEVVRQAERLSARGLEVHIGGA